MDMGIVNALQVKADVYEKVDKELLQKVEDVLLNRSPEATEAMLEYAATLDPKSRPCALKKLQEEVRSPGFAYPPNRLHGVLSLYCRQEAYAPKSNESPSKYVSC